MNELQILLSKSIKAHQNYARKPSKAVRKWDGKTPYSIHPIWCAMTILHETALPEHIRINGYKALLFHDVLEDTIAKLPDELAEDVRAFVQDMTFESSEEEMQKIWDKSVDVKLLKLYDKVSNLLDGSWMSAEKRERYQAYTARLAQEVEQVYGKLNIIKLAHVVAGRL